MERFSPDTQRLEVQGRVVLWHARTGRHMGLAPATLQALEDWSHGLPPPLELRAVVGRLRSLHMLAEGSPPDLSALIPARSRLALTLSTPRAIWFPLPFVRTPGGHAFAVMNLEPGELAIWQACNGARSVAGIARRLGMSCARVLAFLARLTGPDTQLLQLRPRPIRGREASLSRLVAPDRPPGSRQDHHYGVQGETSLERYHGEQIQDGSRHFDDVETTVAHSFGVPHPALDGQRYGARLHQVLEERGLLPDDGGSILEIGPGDGELCEAWLERAAERGVPTGEYIRLDCSAELLATQRRRLPGTREVLGSATDLPFADASLALVICNEVIADLSAVPVDFREGTHTGSAAEVVARIERYGIPPSPGRVFYNLGAWKLIEELARVLRPGGYAFISEFGSLDEIPEETVHLDHPEFSIHFGQLCALARGLGLGVRCAGLDELLGFDLTSTWLARSSYEALRARMRSEGRHLAARAWTPATLELPWRVTGLEWVPISEPGAGPLVTRFMGLLLEKEQP